MIILYDLFLVAVLLMVVSALVWYLSNVIRYLAVRNSKGRTGFFSLADKWLEKETVKKEKSNDKSKKNGKKPAKGAKKHG